MRPSPNTARTKGSEQSWRKTTDTSGSACRLPDLHNCRLTHQSGCPRAPNRRVPQDVLLQAYDAGNKTASTIQAHMQAHVVHACKALMHAHRHVCSWIKKGATQVAHHHELHADTSTTPDTHPTSHHASPMCHTCANNSRLDPSHQA